MILSNCKDINDCIDIVPTLPVCTASGSDIAFKISAVGFNNPSWIILVLSSWEMLHYRINKIVTFRKIYGELTGT